jgi:hypothetical protein
MGTALILGPRAVRRDIIAYRGVKWLALLTIAYNDVNILLSTGTLTSSIRRSWDAATLASFTQENINLYDCYIILPAINPLVSGRSEDDPVSKYVYSIIWTSATQQFVVLYGDLTLAPV